MAHPSIKMNLWSRWSSVLLIVSCSVVMSFAWKLWGSTSHDLHHKPPAQLPTIAVIGRPNSGKSTLVNRLSRKFKDGAIVHDEPGITRDRTYHLCEHNFSFFQVVDTGGLMFDDTWESSPALSVAESLRIKNEYASISQGVLQQAVIALQQADICFFVVDGQAGVNPGDHLITRWLRRNGFLNNHNPMTVVKPKLQRVYVVANKCESTTSGRSAALAFHALGITFQSLSKPQEQCDDDADQTVFAVSALHGDGIGSLMDHAMRFGNLPIVSNLHDFERTDSINVAVIGRPNVGKSSLCNRFVGTNRSIVGTIAGTTRDNIDAFVTKQTDKGLVGFTVVDTAGVRHRTKIGQGLENLMVNRAMKALRKCDVALLVLDAVEGITEQDLQLAKKIEEEGRGCVIVVNKWDAVPSKDGYSFIAVQENIRKRLSALSWAEIVAVSAQSGQRIESIWEAVLRSYRSASQKLASSTVHEAIEDAILYSPPPRLRNRAGRFYFVTQIRSSPPTFLLFVNDPMLFTSSYKRYIEARLRKACKFDGTPIRLLWKGKAIRKMSSGLDASGKLKRPVSS